MWTLWPLLFATLTRHRLRRAFTIGSIAVAFLLYGLLSAVEFAFLGRVELVGQDRLIATHKTSIIESLPRSYLGRVRQFDGVRGAASLTWFGGYFQDPKQALPVFAVDDNYFALYPEIDVAPAALADWQLDRSAALVGSGTMRRYGWQVGDLVPLRSNIFQRTDGRAEWPVRIAGSYARREDDRNDGILLHYEYFNEARSVGRDGIGWMIIRLRDPEAGPGVAHGIDAMFANSPAETRTSSEKSVTQSFANQLGDIGAIIRFVVAAVFFAMLLVTANTMAQSVRERTPEFAVLKTLGFSDAAVLGLVLAESLLLAVAGGAAGLGLALAVTRGLHATLSQFLPNFRLTGAACAVGILYMLLLGLLAGAWPAWSAMRLRIVEALRRG